MELFGSNFVSFLFLQTLAMLLTAAILPRLEVTSLFGAFFAVAALALVNATVWDAALFFKLPNSFTLHAALVFFCNGVIFYVVVKLLPGIEVKGVLPAIAAPVVFSICSMTIHQYGRDIDWVAGGKKAIEFVSEVRESLKTESEARPLSVERQ